MTIFELIWRVILLVVYYKKKDESQDRNKE